MNVANRQLMIALLVLLFAVPAFCWSGGEDKETLELLSTRLNEAIDSRNFHDARETIDELMPLLKDQLKDDKKFLAELKKESDTSAASTFEKNLNRKTELYESLKKLVDVSPAALRVKADQIKSDVKEFLDLS